MNFVDKNFDHNISHRDASGQKNIDNSLNIENSISSANFDKQKKEILLSKMKGLSKSMKDYEIKKKNKKESFIVSNMINIETGDDSLIDYNIDEDIFFDEKQFITKDESQEEISKPIINKENYKIETIENRHRFSINDLDSENILKWYIKISRWPVFFILFFNVLLIILGYYLNRGNPIALNLKFLYLWKLPFEIFIFILLSIYISVKKKKLPRISGFACAFVGFEAGVLIAIIKLFVYRDMWNIFNLSLEGIFLALNGLVFGLMSSAIFFESKK